MKVLKQFADVVDQAIPRLSGAWWYYPAVLAGFGTLCVASALLFYPQGEWTYLLGYRFGGECGMKMQFGLPCPQCGMTRSWVHLVRGNFIEALTYNVAGAMLLVWAATAGLIGWGRLILRNPRALRPPFKLVVAWVIFWVSAPYAGLYTARLLGFNELPEYINDLPLPPGPTIPPGLPRGPDPSAPSPQDQAPL